MQFRVRWEIDIEADSPKEAAQKALEIHRDPGSIATIFEVWLDGEEPVVHAGTIIDLRGYRP
jgi:hypothetical protein